MHSIVVNGKPLTFSGETGDYYFENLPAFQDNNKQLMRVLARVPDGAVCLDIGANIGLTALTMAASLPRSRIYAFEPSPKNLPHLRHNIQANHADDVQIVPSAVGATDGTLAITQPPSGSNTSVIKGDADTRPSVRVPVVSLDRWATDSGIEGVDFIKIDVEGYEPEVLIGAAEMLARCRMPILMEFNSVTISFEARKSPWMFAQELASVFEISVTEEDGTITRIDGDDLYVFALTNMTQRGCLDDVVLRARAQVTAADIRTALSSADVVGLTAEISAVYASTSWRLTAPLRALRRGLRKSLFLPRGCSCP
jgi:FkbM family methyltransferase